MVWNWEVGVCQLCVLQFRCGWKESDIVSAPARTMVRLRLTTSFSVTAFGCVFIVLRNLSRRSSESFAA